MNWGDVFIRLILVTAYRVPRNAQSSGKSVHFERIDSRRYHDLTYQTETKNLNLAFVLRFLVLSGSSIGLESTLVVSVVYTARSSVDC